MRSRSAQHRKQIKPIRLERIAQAFTPEFVKRVNQTEAFQKTISSINVQHLPFISFADLRTGFSVIMQQNFVLRSCNFAVSNSVYFVK